MKRSLLVTAALLSSCGGYTPPEPPSPRDATQVNASMGRTWDAVIDLFAARTIPITTIERVSGLIVTERLSVRPEEGLAWADCGKTSSFMTAAVRIPPTNATYNVLVRGDSARSTVKATVRWVHLNFKQPDIEGGVVECSTKHVYERTLEAAVKDLAEAPRVARGASAEPSIAANRGTAASVSRSQSHSSQSASLSNAEPRRKPSGGSVGARSPTNERLLAEPDFTQAIHDLQVLRFLDSFNVAGDSLLVEVSDDVLTTNLSEYNLGRLFSAYRRITGWSPGAIIVLSRGKRLLGTYSRRGLVVQE